MIKVKLVSGHIVADSEELDKLPDQNMVLIGEELFKQLEHDVIFPPFVSSNEYERHLDHLLNLMRRDSKTNFEVRMTEAIECLRHLVKRR